MLVNRGNGGVSSKLLTKGNNADSLENAVVYNNRASQLALGFRRDPEALSDYCNNDYKHADQC